MVNFQYVERNKMSSEEHTALHAFINEFWVFMKDFWQVDDTDKYWDTVMDKANLIASRYEDAGPDVAALTRKLLVTYLNELDIRNRKARK